MNRFRAETRAWLEANCPESMRVPEKDDYDQYWGGRNPEMKDPDQKVWSDRMGERGWTTPECPSEYGGGGLSKAEAKVLRACPSASCPAVRIAFIAVFFSTMAK